MPFFNILFKINLCTNNKV